MCRFATAVGYNSTKCGCRGLSQVTNTVILHLDGGEHTSTPRVPKCYIHVYVQFKLLIMFEVNITSSTQKPQQPLLPIYTKLGVAWKKEVKLQPFTSQFSRPLQSERLNYRIRLDVVKLCLTYGLNYLRSFKSGDLKLPSFGSMYTSESTRDAPVVCKWGLKSGMITLQHPNMEGLPRLTGHPIN